MIFRAAPWTITETISAYRLIACDDDGTPIGFVPRELLEEAHAELARREREALGRDVDHLARVVVLRRAVLLGFIEAAAVPHYQHDSAAVAALLACMQHMPAPEGFHHVD